MSDTLKRLRCFMQYGELFGSSLEYPVIKTVDGKVIGMCLEKDSPYVHAFVAAPEMLEALKALDNACYGGCACTDPSEEENAAWDLARAALAKAEGGQP